ncbi:MAG: ribonucleoside-diphosphate reductase subunit alpha, partial [Acidobacteria bacterium]|nr:ribonucleoside-diphosphate reductase subunit alpha [Acidobacteriota bacterium]
MRVLKVVKRTGEVVEFDALRIRNAIAKAVAATGADVGNGSLDRLVSNITDEIDSRFLDFYPNVENIQDIVEKHLVRDGLYEIAKAYILYRAERGKVREEARNRAIESARLGKLTVRKSDGRTMLFNVKHVDEAIRHSAHGLGEDLALDVVVREVVHNVYDEIPTDRISQAMILASAAFIERDPAYGYLAARLLLGKLCKEVLGHDAQGAELDGAYRSSFAENLKVGANAGLYDPRLLDFDLDRITRALDPSRDLLFQYLGIQTLYERYLMRYKERPLELPQHFWMRVAMGLAIQEPASA